MKSKVKILIPVVFVLLLLGLGYLRAVPRAKEGSSYPRIEISPQTYNYGNISYGDVVNYDFTVKNSGSQPLGISKVATSCGCTIAKISSQELGPGQTATLHVTYNSGAMTGSMGQGEQERIIYVKSNDPNNPQAEVTIDGYVN